MKSRRNPKPAEISQLREEMGLTQTDFGALLYTSMRQVQEWEGGRRRMPALTWEYACLLWAFPEVERAREQWLMTDDRGRLRRAVNQTAGR